MRTRRTLAIALMALGMSAAAAPASAATIPFPKTLFMDGNGHACAGLFNAQGQAATIYAEHCTPLG